MSMSCASYFCWVLVGGTTVWCAIRLVETSDANPGSGAIVSIHSLLTDAGMTVGQSPQLDGFGPGMRERFWPRVRCICRGPCGDPVYCIKRLRVVARGLETSPRVRKASPCSYAMRWCSRFWCRRDAGGMQAHVRGGSGLGSVSIPISPAYSKRCNLTTSSTRPQSENVF
jgi:hypothetical protein